MKGNSLRIITWILIILFAGVTITSIFVSEQTKPLPYSAHNTEQNGVRAAYLLMGRLGLDVRIASRNVSDNMTGTLVLMRAGYTAKTDNEWTDILGWIYNGGNNLVFIGDYLELNVRLNTLDLPAPMPAMGKWGLFGVFYEAEYGAGKIRYYPDTYRLTNGSITPESAKYLLACFWDFRDKPVYFDEYARTERLYYYPEDGVIMPEEEFTPADLLPESVNAALFQLACAALIIMLLYKQRVGRPVIYRTGRLRRDNEDVFAMGGLMRRDGLREDAALICFDGFSHAVTGLPDADSHKLEDSWRAYGYPYLNDLINLAREADSVRAGRPLSGKDTVRIIGEIDRLAAVAKGLPNYLSRE